MRTIVLLSQSQEGIQYLGAIDTGYPKEICEGRGGRLRSRGRWRHVDEMETAAVARSMDEAIVSRSHIDPSYNTRDCLSQSHQSHRQPRETPSTEIDSNRVLQERRYQARRDVVWTRHCGVRAPVSGDTAGAEENCREEAS